MKNATEQSQGLMRDALSEAQATVRGYDTKAQIVGIGYIFALGIIGRWEDWFPRSDLDVLQVLGAWLVVIVPIGLFGYVLYPTRRMAPKLANETQHSSERVLYINPRKIASVSELKSALAKCDPVDELAHELLKVSMLRELKRQRFLRALFAAGISFLLLFSFQVLRSL